MSRSLVRFRLPALHFTATICGFFHLNQNVNNRKKSNWSTFGQKKPGTQPRLSYSPKQWIQQKCNRIWNTTIYQYSWQQNSSNHANYQPEQCILFSIHFRLLSQIQFFHKIITTLFQMHVKVVDQPDKSNSLQVQNPNWLLSPFLYLAGLYSSISITHLSSDSSSVSTFFIAHISYSGILRIVQNLR